MDTIAYPEVPRDARPAGCAVVGIGASAGGLEALQEFLRAARPDSNLAYVLVQHLDPDHDSLLPEILARKTEMPVRLIEDGMAVEANTFYIIPPNVSLEIVASILRLEKFAQPRGFRRPIDTFFKSLAADQGPNAACVVLSGTGADGAQGLRAVKEAGGLTLSQTPDTAKYDGMPVSAAATGSVDHVLDAIDMPAVLQQYFERRNEFGEDIDLAEAIAAAVPDICGTLVDAVGHDFSEYKQNTLVRRIQRRMQVVGIVKPEEYLELLRSHTDECELLFRDLLIHVTEFFRDPGAFELLRNKVIPDVVKNRAAGDEIRVWVPGCSSGEEAYSIAMLLADAVSKKRRRPKIQIIATDIDTAMLAVARRGCYVESAIKDIPEKLRERYLVPEDGQWAIAGEIRRMVRFSPHSMIKDPPFSKLDLISCRNVLIYMTAELQAQIIPLFHYSLAPKGYLLLGSSENIAQRSDLFESIDSHWRLFRRKPGEATRPLNLPFTRRQGRRGRKEARPALVGYAAPQSAARRLLTTYVPAHAVVNERGDITFISGNTSKYLEMREGTPSHKLLEMARPGLVRPLRGLLRKASKDQARHALADVTVVSQFGSQKIDLVVEPLESGEYLVVFQDIEAMRQGLADDYENDVQLASAENIKEIEEDLLSTRAELRATVEELETANEELKSSNEEMMSMNEELQSANEELITVNDELNESVEELARANNDLKNFLESSSIAKVFLDRDLKIRQFTPALNALFPLRGHDSGRKLTEVSGKVDPKIIEEEANSVVRSQQPSEREIAIDDGAACYVMRTLPYRTTTDAVEGTVMTFTDVTRLKIAERELRAESERLRVAMAVGGLGLVSIDGAEEVATLDRFAATLFGYGHGGDDNGIRLPVSDLRERIAPAHREAFSGLVQQALSAGESEHSELQITGADRQCWVNAVGTTLRPHGSGDEQGPTHLVVVLLHDITTRKAAEQILRRREETQRLALDAGKIGTWDWYLDQDVAFLDARQREIIGLEPDADSVVPETFFAAVHEEDRDRLRSAIDAAIEGGTEFAEDVRLIRLCDGEERWIATRGRVAAHDEHGKAMRLTGVNIDITEQKKAVAAERRRAEQHRLALLAGGIGIFDVDLSGGRADWDERAREMLCLGADESLSLNQFLERVHEDDRTRVRAALDEIFGGRGDGTFHAEFRYRCGDECWLFANGRALDGENDAGRNRFVGALLDITERKRSEEARALLARELSHRVKNIMTVVRSMAALSGRSFPEAAGFVQSFQGRIDALSAAHNMLFASEWHNADLRRLVDAVLGPQIPAERVSIALPDCKLEPQLSQTLALFLHELATNAVKYGSLSVDGGTVSLTGSRTTIDGTGDGVVLEWQETGGPPASQPKVFGFGLTMLSRAAAQHRGGETKLEWAPEGLVCTIRLPLAAEE